MPTCFIVECSQLNQSHLPNHDSVGMNCLIGDSCVGFDCCMDLTSTIKQNIHFKFHLDKCLQRFSFGIENLQFTESIFDFPWGARRHFRLRDVVQFE